MSNVIQKETKNLLKQNNKSIIDKLTALWALNESGLGGFLHVFNSPFTGLIVGGIAILLISLIAFYAKNKWQAILKALVIVLIIKMAVSPYSPFTAYISVSFQAVLGAFLFSNFSWKGGTLVALGIVTFLQSALQKLLKLTIIYGTDFWEAINIYGTWIQEKINFITDTSTTSVLISIYLLVYGVGGLLAGLFIKSVIVIISKKEATAFYLKPMHVTSEEKKTNKAIRFKVIWIWFSTVTVIVLAFTFFGGALFGWQKAIYIIARSFLFLILWYLVLGPFVLKIIRKYLTKKESKYQEEITSALDLFPYFRQILSLTWKETKHLNGFTRFKYFIANSISNCIHFKIASE
ncbi:hypothetical protein KO494_06355 [Lacinutrix sp. C3R15]|uniref:hypothetical protein n=1 Tax=Flavobacteriaceae TaxID=49546 RepID=UPI001C085CAC|nr:MULTISPECIES: hypothetical protein [Flavobacteriaceae]MBU2939159.1 hypothetical protein [Lacinutrix sp. C3R15]MDO6622475.1 hypothetical protein [Oceanihabitans sp. 1_MG-2023]